MRVRSLPDALRLATPKKRLPGAGGGFLTRCTLVITSRAREWDKDLVNCIVDETANAERQLSQARNKSRVAVMVMQYSVITSR
jgi:hypothetical protein